MTEKKPRVDTSSGRPRIEERMPQDALEAIMGYLDRETLCTARLVSKTFCAAASAHVCSLTLASTSGAVSFHRYPHARHVTVRHVCASFLAEEESLTEEESLPTEEENGAEDEESRAEEEGNGAEEEESLAQLDPHLRDVATALTIRHYRASTAQIRDYLSQAALMPKLGKLQVEGVVRYDAVLLARCTNLEAIRIDTCSTSVASTIVTMTRLTSLDIGSMFDDGGEARLTWDSSWLGHATNLRSLQALSTGTSSQNLPLIGNLTGLTGLTLSRWDDEASDSLGPLTRLTKLRSLAIDEHLTESSIGIACSLGSGSLLNLKLAVYDEASADSGRYLSRQTALTQLTLGGRQLCNLRHIGALRVELLRCLELDTLVILDAAGLSVLCRATSLTELDIGTDVTQPQMGLSQALARLTQLRSLKLRCWSSGLLNVLDLPVALSPLTALTWLRISSHALDDEDLRVLLGLTGLRVLEVEECRLPDDMLPQLGVLTNLKSLGVWECGVASLAPVSDVLDPLRDARGLQPWKTDVWAG